MESDVIWTWVDGRDKQMLSGEGGVWGAGEYRGGGLHVAPRVDVDVWLCLCVCAQPCCLSASLSALSGAAM